MSSEILVRLSVGVLPQTSPILRQTWEMLPQQTYDELAEPPVIPCGRTSINCALAG
jgi:hypothetical protein